MPICIRARVLQAAFDARSRLDDIEENGGLPKMNQPVERRLTSCDPRDVLSREVLALLRLCGGIRETDHAVLNDDRIETAPPLPTGGSRTNR